MPVKTGKCPFGHEGPLRTLPDGRGVLCPCAGGALYDGKTLVGPKELIVAYRRSLDRLLVDMFTRESHV